ncbi:unnamed protein product [Penicillium glandicola]
MAVPSADHSLPLSIPLSSNFIQPGIPSRNVHFDLAAPARVPSPTASSFPSLDAGIADADLHALEGWLLFQCNPVTPSSACAPTAANHVKNLCALLEDGKMTVHRGQVADSNIAIEPLSPSIREKLSAGLQILYKEAQELYGLQGTSNGKKYDRASVLTLPSAPVLEFLFRACLGCCQPYYPFMHTATLKTNERMEGRNTILPYIMLLLMLSVGAMAAGTGENYPKIAHGLVEICRVSLRNLIERDIKVALDHEVSQCALLNLIASVWNGDKWQMDMHLKADHHDHRDAQVARLESAHDIAHSWEIWKEQERANRTTHSWLILDHEVCLFQDIPTTSLLSSTSLNTPILSSDDAWNAQSTKDWIEEIPSSLGRISIPPSLNDWIKWFSETNDVSTTTHISPVTLRLLLCHLQNKVIQLRADMDQSQGPGPNDTNPQSMPNALLSVPLQRVQELLQKWYNLAKTQNPDNPSSATTSNMILYHLIMLNTIVSFPKIEQLARSSPENDPGSKSPRFPHLKHPHHLENTREVYFHCGQVLRHVRYIPEPSRPLWWAGSVYRIALISWANSMTCAEDDAQHNRGDMDTQTTLLLDALPPDHISVVAYLDHQDGIPAFSGLNGVAVPLGNSLGVIRYCARFLDANIKTKLVLGIQRKLLTMARRWESQTP